MKQITTTDSMSEDFAQHSSAIPTGIEFQIEPMLDCPVCTYWSERLNTSRINLLSSETIREEKRLLAFLREHQLKGACARRLPYLMDLLVETERTQAN